MAFARAQRRDQLAFGALVFRRSLAQRRAHLLLVDAVAAQASLRLEQRLTGLGDGELPDSMTTAPRIQARIAPPALLILDVYQ